MDFIQSKWELNDLYPSGNDEAFSADLELLKEKTAAFEQYRADLNPEISTERFQEILKAYEELTELSHKLAGFTSLQVSADTQDTALLSRLVQTRSVITELSNRVMFFELWFQSLSDEVAAALTESAEGCRYYLTTLRLAKPYKLNEGEEKIINTKNMTGSAAMVNIYNAITNRYVFRLQVNGEEVPGNVIPVQPKDSEVDVRVIMG